MYFTLYHALSDTSPHIHLQNIHITHIVLHYTLPLLAPNDLYRLAQVLELKL
jgi:hypothetical protein